MEAAFKHLGSVNTESPGVRAQLALTLGIAGYRGG